MSRESGDRERERERDGVQTGDHERKDKFQKTSGRLRYWWGKMWPKNLTFPLRMKMMMMHIIRKTGNIKLQLVSKVSTQVAAWSLFIDCVRKRAMSNYKMISEKWIGNDVKGNGRDTVWEICPEGLKKSIQTSAVITGLPAGNLTRGFWNMKHESLQRQRCAVSWRFICNEWL